MKTQLNIPSKLMVGYQERTDTYTGKLAYIVYKDELGVLRKEKSWRGWISKNLGEVEYDNVPTEGFVLNKKAGGGSGWHGRATVCRIYDPRGHEFEITIDNLLFILQECTCSGGKGLEGSFVYAWDSQQLVLLPTNCEEYKNSLEFTALKSKSVEKDELSPGLIYENKSQEHLVYIGQMPYYTQKEDSKQKAKNMSYPDLVVMASKRFVFYNIISKWFVISKDIKNIAIQKSDKIVDDFSELMDLWLHEINSSRPISISEIPLKLPEKHDIYDSKLVFKKFKSHYISFRKIGKYDYVRNPDGIEYILKGFQLSSYRQVSIDEKGLRVSETDLDFADEYKGSFGNWSNQRVLSKEEVENEFIDLFVHLENGNKTLLKKVNF